MDGSPRSTKRRRLDMNLEYASSPLRNTSTPSTPPANGSLKRTTGRSIIRGSGNGVPVDMPLKGRRDALPHSSPPHVNGSSQKYTAWTIRENVSLYDDFDGAHETKTPARSLRSRRTSASSIVQPSAINSGPAQRRGRRGEDANEREQESISLPSEGTMSLRRGKAGRAVPRLGGSNPSQVEADGAPPGEQDSVSTSPRPRYLPSMRRARGGTDELDHTAEDVDHTTPSKEREARANHVGPKKHNVQNTPRRQKQLRKADQAITMGRGRESRRVADTDDVDDVSERVYISPGSAGDDVSGCQSTMKEVLRNEMVEQHPSSRRASGVAGRLRAKTQRTAANGSGNGQRRSTKVMGSLDRTVESMDEYLDGNFNDRALHDSPRTGGYPDAAVAEISGNVDTGDRISTSSLSVGNEDSQSAVVSSRTTPSIDDENSPFRTKPVLERTRLPDYLASPQSDRLADDLPLLKKIVLEKLTQRRPVPVTGLDNEYKKLYQLLEQTIVAGEGNSMLLVGARGSGKTTLVTQVLQELSKDHSDSFHVVRLNGFIHTDDKLALREIWRQLGREMDIEEDAGGKNYADTLSTLLALLSHPSELSSEQSEHASRSVIFIMDEFDLFASHPRQTLLYNLFDIAQSRKAPIAVLGLTTRVDVAESLEKRVKSRFSHRYVYLSLAKNLNAFQEICKAALMVQFKELGFEEKAILTHATKGASKTNTTIVPLPEGGTLASWNSSISKVFGDPSFTSTFIIPVFQSTKSVPDVLTSLTPPISLLAPSSLLSLSASSLASCSPPYVLLPPDSKLTLLTSLSTLALSLLIAAARLDVVTDTDACNFSMAYAEYVTLAGRARIQSAAGGALASGAGTRVWGRGVAKGEWERLVACGLLIPVVGGGASGAGGGVRVGSMGMVRCDVALEEIPGSVEGLDRIMERWCRQI